jgi:integral membrane sensor domain MASE1
MVNAPEGYPETRRRTGKRTGEGQSGGINIHGGTLNTGGGDIVGRDKFVNQASSRELEEALRPLTEAINVAPQEKRAEALVKLDELKKEAEKGEKRDDGVVAKLVDQLVGLVPSAARAVVSAFGTPILGAIAGPVTKFVLGKIRGD